MTLLPTAGPSQAAIRPRAADDPGPLLAPLGYEPALDGLRAVAILTVIAFHTTPDLPGGWLGVDVFFVLSGYLITQILAAEMARSGSIDIRLFYIRRFLRLTPALACLLVFILLRAAFSHAYWPQALDAVLLSGTYLMNWALASGATTGDLLLHTWSLATEEQFYLVLPALLLLIARRNPVPLLLACIVGLIGWRLRLVASGAPFERTYFGFDTHADPLLIGCVLALCPRRPNLLRLAGATILVPLAVLALIALTFEVHSMAARTVGVPLAGLCSAWIVLALEAPSPMSRVLSAPPMVYIGKLSYALYLWHYPLYIILRRHFPDVVPAGVPTLIGLACFPVAMASYHLVEKPFLRLKARLEPSRSDAVRQMGSLSDPAPPRTGL